MVEFGHYQELSWILERVNGARGAESGVKGAGAAGKGVGSGDASSFKQTFVFSATLTLPRRSAERKVKVRQRKNLSGQESVGKWSVYNTQGPLCANFSPLSSPLLSSPLLSSPPLPYLSLQTLSSRRSV